MPDTPQSNALYVAVTGNSRGIGKAITDEIRQRGHYVYHGFTRDCGFDVSDYGSVARAFNDLSEDRVDALVANAGIVELGTVLELTPKAWRRQMAVNLDGVFYCCKEYARLCRTQGRPGKIITIASTAGTGPRPGRSAYAASKAGVISFSLSLAEELKPYGIKVYCVAPGAVATDMRHTIAPDDDFDHMMQPAEVAGLVADLIERGHLLEGQVLFARR